MATLYLTQYDQLAKEEYGPPVPTGQEPSLGDSVLAISGANEVSPTLHPRTRFVMVHTDVVCHIAFGTDPTATTSNRRLPADSTIFYGVGPETKLKIAVIQG